MTDRTAGARVGACRRDTAGATDLATGAMDLAAAHRPGAARTAEGRMTAAHMAAGLSVDRPTVPDPRVRSRMARVRSAAGRQVAGQGPGPDHATRPTGQPDAVPRAEAPALRADPRHPSPPCHRDRLAAGAVAGGRRRDADGQP